MQGASWSQGWSGGPFIADNIKNFANPGSGVTTNCDCALIGPIVLDKRTRSVLVNNNDIYPYTAIGRDYSVNGDSGSYVVDRPVCVSGAASYSQRGSIICDARIISTRAGYSSAGIAAVDQVVTSTSATLGGDSGAPLGDGGNYLGIHYGRDPGGRSSFSKASNLASMNVTARFFS